MKNKIITGIGPRETIAILDELSVPYESWNHYVHNDVDYFARAVERGELGLERGEKNTINLHVFVSVVHVRLRRGGERYELWESIELPNSTKIRVGFDGSVAEKVRTCEGEEPMQAARRGLGEELGQTESRFADPSDYILWPRNVVERLETTEADWYNGFDLTTYHRHHFNCYPHSSLYHPEYAFEANGRKHRFRWKEAEEHWSYSFDHTSLLRQSCLV